MNRAPLARRRTWPTDTPTGHTELVVEADRVGDLYLEVAVHFDGDGPCVCLTPETAREIAGELIRRADLLDPNSLPGIRMREHQQMLRDEQALNLRAEWVFAYSRARGRGLCCDLHHEPWCCDPWDCGPCCDECPTCPSLLRYRARRPQLTRGATP